MTCADRAAQLQTLLLGDAVRMIALRAVAALDLPDGWIGAGFVRNAVWDHLHGCTSAAAASDIDVVWFDRARDDERVDRGLEAQLAAACPGLDWSVKNQARMHRRNGDAPYRSVADAMCHWPETATAVAARCDGGGVAIAAPLGLGDLFALRLRPTPAFAEKGGLGFMRRVAEKRWLQRYPQLVLSC